MTEPGSAVRGLHHIGYWVNDLNAAMEQATHLLGVGPFQVLEHVDLGEFRFRGEVAVLDHSAAFTSWGPVLLELNVLHQVQPADLRDALGVRHGSVSHVAWTTDDLQAERKHMAGAGCPLLTTSAGGAVADWFSGGGLFGHPIEIHQPTAGVLNFWRSVAESSR
jgi:catechol 2,3-dioxygenase-like lactoylglutathione lyase family enzyme